MQITDVRIRKAPGVEGKLKAYCSVVFDGAFVVHELRIVEGINGVFVAMPRRKTGEGEYKDMAHPITAEAREMVQKTILSAYLEAESREPVSVPISAPVIEAVIEPINEPISEPFSEPASA